jgi:hypothetical protein
MNTTISITTPNGRTLTVVQKKTTRGKKVGTTYFAPEKWEPKDYIDMWGETKLFDDVVIPEVNGRCIAFTKLSLGADGSFDEVKYVEYLKALTTRSRTLSAIMEQIRQLINDLVAAKTVEDKMSVATKLQKLNEEYNERKAKFDEADDAAENEAEPAAPVVA